MKTVIKGSWRRFVETSKPFNKHLCLNLKLPGGSEQIFSVFAVALATSIINSVLFSATPAPAEEEFHWCYTDSSCGEEAWKTHFPVSNISSLKTQTAV